jgi:hypothetical protein
VNATLNGSEANLAKALEEIGIDKISDTTLRLARSIM